MAWRWHSQERDVSYTKMGFKQLYQPTSQPMRVAGFMSGSGSNIRKIIEASKREHGLYEVVVLFSDRAGSKANAIGKDFDIPVITRDIEGFYAARGKQLRDMTVRREFDWMTQEALAPHVVNVIAYGGYMSIVTSLLLRTYLGINVHPADLSVVDGNGRRRYTGDKAVAKALQAGERFIRATTHILEEKVDYGKVLMVSAPLDVRAGESADDAQSRLKEAGDWVIFPQTLRYLADGRFARDDEGKIHFDGEPIPNGVRLE